MTTLNKIVPTKKARIASLDFARGMAVLFMVLVHVLDFYGQSSVHDTMIGTIVEYLGAYPAAPVFMFIMGVFIASSTQTLQQGLQRAAWLFLLGYLLNITRLALPMWLLSSTGMSSAPELAYHTPMIEFFIGDILQFAGLAYACCMLIKHYQASSIVLLATTLIVIFISPFIWDIHSGSAFIDEFLKLLWGNRDHGAMFPVFPWLAYPLSGLIFGYKIATSTNLNRLFNFCLLWGAVITALGFIITTNNPEWHVGYFLRGGPGATITNIGLVLVWLWCCQLMVNKVGEMRFMNLFYFWSKNVTTLYIVQWIIIGWGLIVLGFNQLDLGSTLLMMLSVLIASDVITRFVSKALQKKRIKQRLKQQNNLVSNHKAVKVD